MNYPKIPGALLAVLLLAPPAQAIFPRGSGSIMQGSPSATTIYAAWYTGSTSTTTLSCGTTAGTYNIPAVDNGSQTGVTAHWAIVAGLVASTQYYCQVGDGRTFQTTTLAAPSTTALISVTFGSITVPISNQNTGDFYFNVVSTDNITYLATDDINSGWGAGSGNSNMLIAKFTSESPLTGANVNGLSNFGTFATCSLNGRSPKITGMFGWNGELYMAASLQWASNCAGFTPPDSLTYGNIYRSTNKGVSWSNFQAPGTPNANGALVSPVTTTMFASNTSNILLFGTANFVMYGPDSGDNLSPWRVDNADAYAYLVCDDGQDPGGHLYLARVPLQSLPGLDATKIQYYKGGAAGSLDAAWSSNISDIVSTLTFTSSYTTVPAMWFMPSINRYLLMISHDTVGSTSTTWLTYEAPHPWGPFTLINTTTSSPQGYYGVLPLTRSIAGATANGTPFTMIFAGQAGGSGTYQLHQMPMTANTH